MSLKSSSRARLACVEAMEDRRLLSAVVFALDPAQSVLTASGSTDTPIGTINLSPQKSGSLSTSYHGTISADVTGSKIAFDYASNVIADVSGTYKPQSNPPLPPTDPGSAPGNYAAQVSIPFLGMGVVAVRDLAFNIGSEALDIQPNGDFASNGETFRAITGRGDYYYTFGSGGAGTENVKGDLQSEAAEPSRYVVANGVATLTIPVDINVEFAVFGTDPDTRFHLTGRLVATASAPTQTTVIGRQVFYNNSAFDGKDPSLTAQDLNAAAPDKQALLPGGESSFSNVTSYSKGINGVLITFSANSFSKTLTADDFEFRVGRTANPNNFEDAPAPIAVSAISSAADANAKVAIAFADGAIRNEWLQVTVKANENTGLSAPDVFYFGNLVGDTGNQPKTPAVEAADLVRTRNAIGSGSAAITNLFDFDRSSAVGAGDLVTVRNNVGKALPPLQTNAPALNGGVFARQRIALPRHDDDQRDVLDLLD